MLASKRNRKEVVGLIQIHMNPDDQPGVNQREGMSLSLEVEQNECGPMWAG